MTSPFVLPPAAALSALREALVDASPARALLNNRRPEVRVAALAALEFRSHWRYGQAEVVLQLARNSPEPEVRAAAAKYWKKFW